MTLPTYNENIALEKAIEQYDFASGKLALEYSLESALDVNNAFSRVIGALGKAKSVSLEDISRILRDTEACLGLLGRVADNYGHLEKREANTSKKKDLKKEKDTIGYYMTLMRQRKKIVQDIAK